MSPKPNQEHLLPPPSSSSSTSTTTNNAQKTDDDPPDSFWLSQDAELDWLDRNAFLLHRSHSTKAIHNHHHHQSSNPSTAIHNNKLQSMKMCNSSIIWVPHPTQRRSSFPDSASRPSSSSAPRRSHRESVRLLVPKRTDPIIIRTEPSSPIVSCIGRVRPKPNQTKTKTKKKKIKKTTLEEMQSGGGLWKRLREVFRSGKLKKTASVEAAEEAVRFRVGRSRSARGGQSSSMLEPLTEPVSVGLKLDRFASGRKSDTWVAELKDVINEVEFEMMEYKTSSSVGSGGLWRRRRNVEALETIDCGRDWLVTGPASV